jgi:hypothetical protein
MDSSKHRIRIKIGDNEFDAEGEQTAVQSQFQAFLAALSAVPAATPAKPGTPQNSQTNPHSADPGEFSRIFRQGEPLSLLALPRGKTVEADALLMLLYGYTKLGSEPSTTGTTLMKAAKLSGVSISRIDRIMDGQNKEFVLAAGVKKARRYSLNNPGVARAESLMKQLFE